MTPVETAPTRRIMDTTMPVKIPTTIIVDTEVKEPVSSLEFGSLNSGAKVP